MGKFSEKERRSQRRADGICTECGEREPAVGRAMCETCLAKCREYHKNNRVGRDDSRRLRAKRQQDGVCVRCGNNPPHGKTLYCEACATRQASFYTKRREAGLCGGCGGQVPPGQKCCDACRVEAKDYLKKLRDAVFAAYGGYTCVCCGETEPFFLQLDHINNDGSAHRRKIAEETGQVGGGSIYRWLKNNGFPPGFQVLCANCNHAKSRLGYCPHKPPPDTETHTGAPAVSRRKQTYDTAQPDAE